MKIKHYGIFKTKMKKLNWESLRNNEGEKPYYLPFTKEAYLSKVDTDGPSPLTKVILNEIEKMRLKKVFSIGSGIGAQEYQLKKFSDYSVIVTDYNSSVLRLKQFNIFDDVILLDAFNDPLPVDPTWVMLLPRIDTEFNDSQLSKLFATCHENSISKCEFYC